MNICCAFSNGVSVTIIMFAGAMNYFDGNVPGDLQFIIGKGILAAAIMAGFATYRILELASPR